MTLAKSVGKILKNRGLWLATAESCTGGYISNAITDVPGSSKYFKGGISAYSNEVKIHQLDVNSSVINQKGAVSKEVALEMARGVALTMETDIGISTTGIAGPGGGSDEKPVGTIWIGFWNRERHFALHAQFTNDRLVNKERSSSVALEMVRRTVLNIEHMPYGLKKYPA
jgi:nicotinamide-nucleotide amidase